MVGAIVGQLQDVTAPRHEADQAVHLVAVVDLQRSLNGVRRLDTSVLGRDAKLLDHQAPGTMEVKRHEKGLRGERASTEPQQHGDHESPIQRSHHIP